jgi:hypothetical protein
LIDQWSLQGQLGLGHRSEKGGESKLGLYCYLNADWIEVMPQEDIDALLLTQLDEGEGRQEFDRFIEEVACEHWHRMLFARFLAENKLPSPQPLSQRERGLKESALSGGGMGLLMYYDPDDSVPLSLEECEDLAADEDTAYRWELAARYTANIPLSLWERGQG